MISTAQAIAASVACARQVGLPADDPHVVAEGYSVRVHLRPAPVVTRVLTLGTLLRGPALPWLQREVAVAEYAAAHGAAVVPAWSEPGPHLVRVGPQVVPVTLWQGVEHLPGVVPEERFGPLLHDLHLALEGCSLDLPLLSGPRADVLAALDRHADPVLHEGAEDLLPLSLTWPRRPLHGDAHTGNLLLTPDGPRWTDFEDVCVGPVEWDLASLTVSGTMVASYPAALDRRRLADCRDLRRLQVLANLLTDHVHAGTDPRSDPLHATVTAALAGRR